MMKRQVLFRGKRVDSCEWIIGSLIVTGQNKVFILLENCTGPAYTHQVISETVGQFIGLVDKNSAKIFEHDKFLDEECSDSEYVIVEWDKERCSFMAVFYGYDISIGEGSQEVYSDTITEIERMSLEDFDLTEIEVIGNIHDK